MDSKEFDECMRKIEELSNKYNAEIPHDVMGKEIPQDIINFLKEKGKICKFFNCYAYMKDWVK